MRFGLSMGMGGKVISEKSTLTHVVTYDSSV